VRASVRRVSASIAVAVLSCGFVACSASNGINTDGSAAGRQSQLGFANPLRIPPLAQPTVTSDGVKRFELNLQADGMSQFLLGVTTRTWGINGAYLGPTIRAARGDRVQMVVRNQLNEATTLHWHGMRLPARMDGGPHQMIQPGKTWTPEWTIDQPAATTWFHPHPHGSTAMHVYRGLAGMFIIDEPGGSQLPSTYGVDDIPLIIQDKRFRPDGSLNESAVESGTFGLVGDTFVVNGTHDPYLEVGSQLVRLRLLNASNARVFQIGVADERAFHVVATDGGLLEQPVQAKRIKLSPGERVEVVARFAPGEQVVLNSRGEDGDQANIEEGDFDLLKIVAKSSLAASAPLQQQLGGALAPPAPPGAKVRTFKLGGSEINDKDMDMSRIDEVVPAGAHEIWEITNTTFSHNFHIHEVAFRIVEVNGAPPPAYQQGPKDTVFVPRSSKVRLAVQFGHFSDPTLPYMYHCHILRHEDKGMMGQFVIVEPGSVNQVPRVLATNGHRHR